MADLSVVSSYDVKLTSDCVEWSAAQEHSVLACASYQLDKTTRTRIGELRLYRFSNEGNQDGEHCPEKNLGTEHLGLIKSVDSAGIFDIKFSSLQENRARLLASATASGHCDIYPFSGSESIPGDPIKLNLLENEQDEAYCLSVDWNDRKNSQNALKVAVSLSNGYISVLEIRDGADAEVVNSFFAHEYPYLDAGAEAWITSFDCWNPNVLYSGADDSKLKVWDLNAGIQKPVLVNSTSHSAGVCSMQTSVHEEHLLVTGSYDNCIRLWDKRNLRCPTNNPYDVGGGVWRLKFHPHAEKKNLLLAACMRSGFRIFNISSTFKSESNAISLVSCYNNGLDDGKWESLAYGVDWIIPDREKTSEDFVAGASFYDHTLRLFKCEISSRGA